mgnify:CR=1 FL=1
MKLLECRIVLKSPAIITERRTERGFVRPLNHIPGSTLRGAILTALYNRGLLGSNELSEEAKKPSLLVSPAYPVVKGVRTVPATPFIARCRICGEVVDTTSDAAEKIGVDKSPSPLTVHCKSPLKSLLGSPVFREGEKLLTYRPSTFRATSVGISKGRGSAMRGMLFDYEAIAEGEVFWARMAAPDSLELPRELEIAVGRGQSRGFGWASLSLNPSQAKPLGETRVFIAFSPLTPLRSMNWEGCELNVHRIYGRTSRILSGWDLASGKHKPFIMLARQGSIVRADLLYDKKEMTAAISHGGVPIQTSGFWLTGVNVLIPVEEYLRILGGGVG